MKELIVAVRYLTGVSLWRLGWLILPDQGKDDWSDLLTRELDSNGLLPEVTKVTFRDDFYFYHKEAEDEALNVAEAESEQRLGLDLYEP